MILENVRNYSSYFKHYLIFFNANELLAVPFIELVRGWVPCGLFPFLLFALDYLSEHSHSHTGLNLLIARNLPCYLHFSFCLFV